jgi:hypothetical protein
MFQREGASTATPIEGYVIYMPTEVFALGCVYVLVYLMKLFQLNKLYSIE